MSTNPTLNPTWSKVDQFEPRKQVHQGMGSHKKTGNRDEDTDAEDEWEEEEISYLTLDFGTKLDIETWQSHRGKLQLLGLESSTPYARIGPHFFMGRHENLTGSEVLLQQVPDTAEKTTRFTPIATTLTAPRITFKSVKLEARPPKEGTHNRNGDDDDESDHDDEVQSKATNRSNSKNAVSHEDYLRKQFHYSSWPVPQARGENDADGNAVPKKVPVKSHGRPQGSRNRYKPQESQPFTPIPVTRRTMRTMTTTTSKSTTKTKKPRRRDRLSSISSDSNSYDSRDESRDEDQEEEEEEEENQEKDQEEPPSDDAPSVGGELEVVGEAARTYTEKSESRSKDGPESSPGDLANDTGNDDGPFGSTPQSASRGVGDVREGRAEMDVDSEESEDDSADEKIAAALVIQSPQPRRTLRARK